jgi:hypothetical protein
MDYSNMKFGHLTLLRYARAGGRGVGRVWLAKCDCGSEVEVVAKDVVAGRVKSCGRKCEYSRKLRGASRARTIKLHAAERRLYLRHYRYSIARGISWDLGPGDFRRLISECCTYCGERPGTQVGQTGLLYNSVDLVEAVAGYTPGNVNPICRSCKVLKGNLNTKEFLESIEMIHRHLSIGTSESRSGMAVEIQAQPTRTQSEPSYRLTQNDDAGSD